MSQLLLPLLILISLDKTIGKEDKDFCRDHCNESLLIKTINTTVTLCSCDSLCMAYADCCPDFAKFCHNEYSHSKRLFVPEGGRVYGSSCEEVKIKEKDKIFEVKMLMVHVCPNGTLCRHPGTNVYNLTNINHIIPVTDNVTGVHYINAACAMCNGVQTSEPWSVGVACTKKMNQEARRKDLTVLLKSNSCTVYFESSKYISNTNKKQEKWSHTEVGYNHRHEHCNFLTSSCRLNCTGESIEKGCVRSVYQSHQSICELSSQMANADKFCLGCKVKTQRTTEDAFHCGPTGCSDTYSSSRTNYISVVSLSRLFSHYNKEEGITLKCPLTQVSLKGEAECRAVWCGKGQQKVGSTCYVSVINLNLTYQVLFSNISDLNVFRLYMKRKRNSIFESFRERFRKMLKDYRNGSTSVVTPLEASIQTSSIESIGYHITILMKISIDFKKSPFNISLLTEEMNETMTNDMKSILIDVLMKGNFTGFKVTSNQSRISPGTGKSRTECKWLVFRKHEYEKLSDDRIKILSNGEIYSPSDYEAIEGNLQVCIHHSLIQSEANLFPAAAEGLGAVSLVLTVLSILCLQVRLLFQGCVPMYQSVAGWLQCHLCLALCLAFICLLLSGAATQFFQPSPFCVVVAVLTYWMFLAAFFWMTSIAVNTYLAFRPSAAFTQAKGKDGYTVTTYALLSWLLPLILVAGALAVNFSPIENRFKPRFGHRVCWFSQYQALLVFFVAPIGCGILTTLVLYTMVVISVRRRLKTAPLDKHVSNKPSSIKIYISLFFLMGISWVFGFFAMFIKLDGRYETALWYVFVILNASQGIFIFLLFVCKKNVFRQLKKSLLKAESAESTTASTDYVHVQKETCVTHL